MMKVTAEMIFLVRMIHRPGRTPSRNNASVIRWSFHGFLPYILIALLFTLHLLLPGLTRAYDWKSIGPQGDTPKRFLLPPESSGYEQLGATMRSLFARTPAGEWIPISPEYGGFATWTIDDIAVAPSAPGHIYLLRTGPYTGTSIYRTLDGGYSWDLISLPVEPGYHYVYCVAVHPQIPDTVYAGSFTSLFRSDDAGDSWEDIGVPPPDLPIPTDLVIRPDSTSLILVGSRGDYPGIYRSPDQGISWDRVFDEDHIEQLLSSPENPLLIYALTIATSGLEPARLFRSTDGGTSWSLWSSAAGLATHLVVDPNDPLKMYVLGLDEEGARNRVLASTDAGSTWSVVTTTEDVETSSFMSLGIAPGSEGGPAVLYLGTNFWGTFRSADDGASWEPERFHAAYIGAVAADPRTPGRVYAGTAPALNQSHANGRLFTSEDGGTTWSHIGRSANEEEHPVGRIWAIRPSMHATDRVWVGTSYGLFASEDGGRTLLHSGSGPVRSIMEDPADAGHVFIGTSWVPTVPEIPPRLLETTDGGSAWEVIREFDHPVLDIEVDVPGARMYCALGALTISGLSGPGGGGLVWRDEAGEWTEAPDLSGKHVSRVVIDRNDSDRLYVSTLDEGVLTSVDRGMSWSPMNSGLDDTGAHALIDIGISGREVDLVVGTWQGTYRWMNGHWENLSAGIIAFPSGGDSVALHTTALAYDPLSEKLYVGTAGRSAFVLDGLVPNDVIGEDREGGGGIPRALALHQNYPNPFNPTTTISLDVPGETGRPQHLTLTIYDLRGKQVRSLIDRELMPGRHRFVWDGRGDRGEQVPSGIYLYALKCGETSRTRKMLLEK